ncbi:unnamed protein product [Arabidopsis lyrata]|nr:unnamed protein product [Arabidopsis lyrata]
MLFLLSTENRYAFLGHGRGTTCADIYTVLHFYCADLTLIILGAIAYYFKISKSKASGT